MKSRIILGVIASIVLTNSVSAEPLTESLEVGVSDDVYPSEILVLAKSEPVEVKSEEHSDHHEPEQNHMPHDMPMESVEMEPEDQPSPMQALIMTNMYRDGSGTGWIPMDNPMLMKMRMGDKWTTMLHWSAFADYDYQTGDRGNQGFYSQNWVMGSAMRPVGKKGLVQFRGMFSLEPLTIGKRGYPVLFQTGETFNNESLIDRQHPHDLFMELSAQYYHQVTENTLLRAYIAPVGEPALGPIAFPHRYSAFLNPDSPLSHHIQDSTHVAFGVGTLGVIYKNKLQIESSVFNGREPDENRYDFDYEHWRTSYSGRISFMPTKNWVFQTSYGFLNQPEALEKGNLNRLTSSVQYGKTWERGWYASTLSWGHNFKKGDDEDGILLENVVNFLDKNYLISRIEHVRKHGYFDHHDNESLAEKSFNITAFSLGVARDLFSIKDIPITLGAMVTMFAKPSGLNQAYGNFPMGFHVFLHTNAPRMQMNHHSRANQHNQ